MAAGRTQGCSRRVLLTRAATLASLLSLTLASGCRVRLEDDAPHLPLVPTRARLADEGSLRTALAGTWILAEQVRQAEQPPSATGASSGSTATVVRLRAVHDRQAAVLAGELTAGGAPLPARSTPAPAGRISVGRLRSAEQASAASLERELGRVSASSAALFVSLAAERATAAQQLGSAATPSATLGPTPTAPTAPTGSAAAPLLAANRAAVYGLEVVAARADRTHRPAADACLSVLRRRSTQLETLAGSAAGPPPLGYALPYQVGDARAATALARRLIGLLSRGLAAAAAPLAGDATALRQLAAWLAEDEGLAARWGASPAAFPGLVTPTSRPAGGATPTSSSTAPTKTAP